MGNVTGDMKHIRYNANRVEKKQKAEVRIANARSRKAEANSDTGERGKRS